MTLELEPVRVTVSEEAQTSSPVSQEDQAVRRFTNGVSSVEPEPEYPDLTPFLQPSAPVVGLKLYSEDCLSCVSLCKVQEQDADNTPDCHFANGNKACPATVIHFIFTRDYELSVQYVDRVLNRVAEALERDLSTVQKASLQIEAIRRLTDSTKVLDAAVATDGMKRLNTLFS